MLPSRRNATSRASTRCDAPQVALLTPTSPARAVHRHPPVHVDQFGVAVPSDQGGRPISRGDGSDYHCTITGLPVRGPSPAAPASSRPSSGARAPIPLGRFNRPQSAI